MKATKRYAELGMYRDANDELEKIDPFLRAAPEVLALRIADIGLRKGAGAVSDRRRCRASVPRHPVEPVRPTFVRSAFHYYDNKQFIVLDQQKETTRDVAPKNAGDISRRGARCFNDIARHVTC